MAQTANSTVLAAGLQTQDTQSLGNNHLLLLVVWGRDTLEDLEALQGGGTTGSLVGDHAADSLVEDAGWGAVVEGTLKRCQIESSIEQDRARIRACSLTTAGGVVSGHLAQVGVVLDCTQHC